MEYAIIIFLLLATLHFVYEAIIAPSLRLNVRFDLFNLRDELRALKITHRDALDDKHYHYLQDSINTTIGGLPRLDIFAIISAMGEMSKDKELKQRVLARIKILDDCKFQEAQNIRKKTIGLAVRAFIINTGGWAFYIVPIAIALALCKTILESIKSLVSTSDIDFNRVAPAGALAV